MKLHYYSKNLKIVDVFMLLKSSCNPSSSVLFDVAVNIPFPLKNPLYCQNVLVSWPINQLSSTIFYQGIIFFLHYFFLFTWFRALHYLFKAKQIWRWTFSFTCNPGKTLRLLRQCMGQGILKKHLTRLQIQRVVWNQQVGFALTAFP